MSITIRRFEPSRKDRRFTTGTILRNCALIRPGLMPGLYTRGECCSKRLQRSLLLESQRIRKVKYFMGEMATIGPRFQQTRLDDGTIEISILEYPDGPFSVDPELIETSEWCRNWLAKNCEYMGNDPYIFARDFPVYKYAGAD